MQMARIALAAAFLIGASNASAGTDKVALVVSGTAADHARELATTTIESIARETGLSLTKPAVTAKETAAIKGCATAARAWSCVSSMLRDKEVQQVAFVSLVNDTGPDSSPMIVITEQVIVAHLDAAVTGQRFCVRCTDDVLVNVTTELTRALFQEIEVRSGRTVVAVKSTPRGARILFDGNSVGATDRSFNTFPGKHTVVLELDGYQREPRLVEAAVDKTSEVSVTMRPLRQSSIEDHGGERCEPSPPGSLPPTRLAPKLVIGAGALALVAGVIVLALDENPTAKSAGMEQPRVYYDTTAPGVGLVIGGAVAGVGGYLWWRYTRSTVTPALAAIPGGATVGISRAF
jgi:hypothetical protein